MKGERRDGGVLKAAFLGFLVLGSVVVFLLGVMVGSNVRVPPEAITGTSHGGAPAGGVAAGLAGDGLREEVDFPRKGVEDLVTFPETLREDSRREIPAAPAQPAQPLDIPQAPVRVTDVLPGDKPAADAPPATETAGSGAAETPAPTGSAPSPAPRERSEGPRFSAQVIASRDEAEARAAAAILRKAGFEATVSARTTGKGRFYVVRTGRSSSEAETRKVLAEVKRRTKFKDAFLATE